MTKVVLFDLDGLMVESEILHYQAYAQVLVGFGYTLTLEDYFLVWGSDKDMSTRMADKFTLSISKEELLLRKNKIFRDVFIHRVVAQKGLLGLLQLLKDREYLLAVVSSSQMHEIEIVLAAIGVKDFFNEVVSAESVEHGKPAPDCYELAAKKLHVQPSRCLVLEDSPKGVQAAKSAGMKCYAIPSYGLEDADFTGADRVLESLEDVWILMK